MPTYGRQLIGPTTGNPIQVSADGDPDWKTGGITIDWTTVVAVGSDTTLPDGNVIPAGQKGLALGQVLCVITASGKYGPYLSGATDGRQTLTQDQAWILNESVLQLGPGNTGGPTDHPGVFDGGKVWQARLGVGAAGQPTLAALRAVMPRLQLVNV
jgi:hypothetical protein